MTATEDALRAFVEQSIGGPVHALERTAVGSSRVTLLVEAEDAEGRARQLVVRHDSGDGPLSGTDVDLAHEAAVYLALAGHGVRIPRLVAEAEDGRTLLVERVRGSEDFAGLEPAARAAVAEDFAAALAELHAVDPSGLSLPGFARPRTPQEHLTLDLERWVGFQRDRVEAPDETTLLAGEWLATAAPAEVERTALCHGDAGAGNFLHEGGRVTALLDWEFAHLGDPLDDVAWVLVRSHLLGGEDEMRAALPTWSRLAGLPLDAGRIRTCRAFVLLRMAISCQLALAHASRSGAMDTTTYELLIPTLGFLLPQALREAGCTEPELDGLERAASERIETHPVLKGLVRPLAPWEAP